MSCDDKTRHVMAASHLPDASRYCPECGRLWHDLSPVRLHRAPPFPWRAALLGGVGFCLLIVFGLRAASAYQTGAAIRRALADPAATWSCSPAGVPCPPAADPGARLDGPFGRYDAAQRQLHAAGIVATFGLVALLVGLGSATRRHARAGRHSRGASLVSTVWGVGEGLIALVCLQVVGSYVDHIAVLLCLGSPPTRQTLDLATDGMVAVISKMLGG